MIESAARDDLAELRNKLRPFIARRVRQPADVDDVLQDVFLRMQRGLPGLQSSEGFGPWLYRVARSAIADHRRAVARHPLAEHRDDAEPDPEDDAFNGAEQELAAFLASFVTLLPSPYREALTLTELQGMSQKDAAEMLGISLSGMKSRVQRGRRHLRRALEDCCHIALDARGRVIGCEPRPDGRLPDGRPLGRCDCG